MSRLAQLPAPLRTALAEQGLQVQAWRDSPIVGGDGNREFFVQALQPAN